MVDSYHWQDGFTLVEVVVAAALLILALSAFIASFVQAGRSAAIADNRLDAVHNARQQMETLISYPYNASALSIGTHTFSNGFYVVTSNASAKVKDISVSIRCIHPVNGTISTVTLAGSISSELHQ
jgi:type II secretory pathway pseudopilin PulG